MKIFERLVLLFYLTIFLIAYSFVNLLSGDSYVFPSSLRGTESTDAIRDEMELLRFARNGREVTYSESKRETLKTDSKNANKKNQKFSIERKAEAASSIDTGDDFCLNVPVFLYHHIEPMNKAIKDGHSQLTVDSTVFEEQVKYLIKNGYRTISADELVNALINSQPLSGRPVVITVDDGYDDNYEYAYQISKSYNVILNLMIPTGLIGTNGYLTWDNLREMKDSRLVFLYNHTLSHFSLPSGDDKTAEIEILAAQIQLQRNLGITPRIFSYPYGSSNERDINILKKNGFLGAFSTRHSFTQCKEKIFNLKRNHIGNAPLSYYGL